MTTIRHGHATNVGKVRDHNEDSYFTSADQGLWLIADGMGGHEGGEIASAIVCEAIPERVRAGATLAEALEDAHKRVLEAVAEGRGRQGMGSTAVALKVTGGRYETAWVGDSRAYLWDGSRLQQLSRDHSYVQKMLDEGAITAEEALTHPDRNVITQALGSDTLPAIRVDRSDGTLHRGEFILLCSDGLTAEVSDPELAHILSRGGEEQAIVDALVEQALINGGSDNITVILVSAPPDAPFRRQKGGTAPMSAITATPLRQGRSGHSRLFLGVVLAGLLALLWVALAGRHDSGQGPPDGINSPRQTLSGEGQQK